MSQYDCVQEAAAEILKATCGLKVTPQEPTNDSDSDVVVIAVMGLIGDVNWSLFLGLSQETASSVASSFAGFPIPFESSDMGDAIGELANILAGTVKAKLFKKGLQVTLSLPSVLRAEGIHVLNRRDAQTVHLCFDSSLGPIWTGVIIQPESKPVQQCA